MVERSLCMREDSLLLDFPRSFLVKKELTLEGRLQLSATQFKLDVEGQEPSVSTLLVNIDSEFDPYGAMSTPLYQTATFKQRRKTGPMIILEVEILHEILWKGSWQSLRGQIEHFALPVEWLLYQLLLILLEVENAQKIAEFLSSHPWVKKVNYAGLPGHPGCDLHYSQVLDMDVRSVKSLVSLPCFMSHASIPNAVRDARGLTEDLVRISVGIEDVNDLIADLDDALRTGPL
ncbi:hypothetical protein V6N11_055392 [Hibiscus sabdariffa]|uniref:Uncharacterized protein n=1 Tax=Hibiscus sabdariffa TaxID=183260 RepID=A0ABR2PFL0_9ROSI